MNTATLTRPCIECGKENRAWSHTCDACRYAALPLDVKREREKAKKEARKRWIRQNGRTRVSKKTLKEIRNSGNCSYCPEPAVEVDHIWALSRGGPDLESNIGPSCLRCSRSKGAKTLLEWSWERVAYGVLHSEKVGRELSRLSAIESPDQIPAAA